MSSMRPVVSPTFLKRCTTLRGIKTDGAGPSRRGLATDSQFNGALDDEEHFFPIKMDMVARAFTGFYVPHEDRDSAAGGLGGKEYFQIEAERLDRKRLFGPDDGGL